MIRESEDGAPAGTRRPRVLMLVTDMPARTGTGAAVRTYHFARALADFGELHLAVLSPEAEAAVPADLTAACHAVLLPASTVAGPAKAFTRSAALRKAAAVLLTPWRNNWEDLYSYASGCGISVFTGEISPGARATFPRRLLTRLLRFHLNLSARYFSPPPLMVFKHYGSFRNLLPGIKAAGGPSGFDFVWFEHGPCYPFAAQLRKEFPHARLVCNTHNIESNLAGRIQTLAPRSNEPGWLRHQPKVLGRVEARAFAASNLTFVCSEEDHRLGSALAPQGTFRVIGNGVDTHHFRPSSTRQQTTVPTILFTGTMKYPPNLDAVAYFITGIFPKIRARLPECQFVIAGRDAEEALRGLDVSRASVVAVSNPDDMRPLFESASVCVVPLRAGGGTRLKIPEAMAMQCAVVSTTAGAEGVPYQHDVHLLLADTPEDFSEAVLRVLTDDDLRSRLAESGAGFIRRNYDWGSLAQLAMRELQSFESRTPQKGPLP